MSNNPTREGTVLSLRVTNGDVDALDRIRLTLRQLGFDTTRHAAARAALRRGLVAMQQDAIEPRDAN